MINVNSPTIFFDKTLYRSGDYKCYYCGSSCNQNFSVKEYVKKTFTNRDIVAQPASMYVCGGCVASFAEKITVQLMDDEIRDTQRVRQYSWIITENSKIAATKKHIKELREVILNPPNPPFLIVLADSGQKHLIFRSKIAYSKDIFPVTLEDQVILVRSNVLRERIEMLKPIIAATGKPAISDFVSVNLAISVIEYHGKIGEKYLEEFLSVKDDALTKLALWLAPNKEDCSNEYTNNR
ncbi:hypothetical protein [Leptospira noguchii]|uniref:Uncharacterized protein n=1 Tax=Leptospira noguchii TaxID=28182 RepID=M6VFU9_9LEPT|nr:hypothetical protein [Leptospira noguchii]EMO53921.1 hypothetical protein LEP1GSC172_3310 [Leptospira noguchii]